MQRQHRHQLRRTVALAGAAVLTFSLAPAAVAHPESDAQDTAQQQRDPDERLEAHDAATSDIVVSDGPATRNQKNLAVVGRGERVLPEATTDVWALDGYAYIGTFNSPCGTGEGFVPGQGGVSLVDDVAAPGVPIFDVSNRNRPAYAGNLPSVEGSRVNDVKVASLNSGDVLVHSNEGCGGGPGGFEIYNVDDPTSPEHLTSVTTGDVNPSVVELFETTDEGVHNLFLFTQGNRDFVAATVESVFDNFQVFDITDPTDPVPTDSFGAEDLLEGDVGDSSDEDVILDTFFDYLNEGFGQSSNRFLHDITVNADGTRAYLSNWDAGLILLDISNPDDFEIVSQAIDPENGSLDGEVNAHAAWPNEDGSIVVGTEEDFDAFEPFSIPSFTFGSGDPATPIPGVAASTTSGNTLEGSPTGNTGTLTGDSLEITSGPLAGSTFQVGELSGDQPKLDDAGAVTGEVVFIGRSCNGDAIENAAAAADGTVIAVARRGGCTFRQKGFNAAGAGADAVVIANNLEDATPWGGLRIWDYADPAAPVLASTFYTECATESLPTDECRADGTYTVHNVQVETRGNKTLAYVSWYSDGMLVLDVSDPYNPIEIARFSDTTEDFEAANGGPQDFWGVYKEAGTPFFYGSDRNGGLYTFKLLGKGNGKN